jgi:hypothetical protein
LGSLGRRVEVSDLFDYVSEKLDPDRMLSAGGENIDDFATKGKGPRILDRVDSKVA